MNFGVVTLFPEMFRALTDYGVVSRALQDRHMNLSYWNPRDFARDRHRTVDDRPYGGGPGMVMMAPPLADALAAARERLGGDTRVLYLSPQGRRLTQADVVSLSQARGLILIAGRYEGVDRRLVETEADEEISIGDFVLSGGELAAMVLVDAVVRLLPGVLGNEESAVNDSFSAGLLDWPHYTRPRVYKGQEVPPVLLSGDHRAIQRWRFKQALGRTWERRPDLLEKLNLGDEERQLLREYMGECDAAPAVANREYIA